jgi:putative flippase GtrA
MLTKVNFLISGVISFLIYYSSLYLFFDIFQFSMYLSVTISYLLSSIFNFFYNRNVTFSALTNSYSYQLSQFLLMQAYTYVINLLILFILDNIFHINLYLSSVVSIFLLTFLRFVYASKVVFVK